MLKNLWASCKKTLARVIFEDDYFYYPETLLQAAKDQPSHSTNRRVILAGALEHVAEQPLARLRRRGYLLNEEAVRKEIEEWIGYLEDVGKLAERIPVLKQLTAATMLSFAGLLPCGDPLQTEIKKDLVPRLTGSGQLAPLDTVLDDVRETYGRAFGPEQTGFFPKPYSLSDIAGTLIIKLHHERLRQGMNAKATLQP